MYCRVGRTLKGGQLFIDEKWLVQVFTYIFMVINSARWSCTGCFVIGLWYHHGRGESNIQRLLQIGFLFLSCFVPYVYVALSKYKEYLKPNSYFFHTLSLMRCFTILLIAMTLWWVLLCVLRFLMGEECGYCWGEVLRMVM